MLQRIQTIYLLIFIVLSSLMLTDISILEFQASGEQLQQPIIFQISSVKLEGTGQTNLLSLEEIQQFADQMNDFELSFDTQNQKLSYSAFSPLLIGQILLTLLAIFTLFGYKNLKRQLNFARATFFLSLLYVLGVMGLVYFANGFVKPYLDEIPLDNLVLSRHTNVGFYLICAMLPFAYLAQMGIKRDLTLIKSLDRLR